ncbi:MAG: hypothetical protein WB757_05395 [Candidatus Cybelea sp.]|jgi:hypothetical protein
MHPLTSTLKPLAAASIVLAAATACASSSAIPPTFGGAQGPGAVASVASVGAAVRTNSDAPAAKKKKKPLLYVADYGSSVIYVFDQTKKSSPQPKYTISAGLNVPEGITTDKSGNLYVANFGANQVSIYAPGATKPTSTITTGLNGPTDVAVDAYGNAYVSNAPRYGSASNYINEYPAGSSSPSFTWYPPSYVSNAQILGITLVTPTQDGSSSVLAAMNVPYGSHRYSYGDVASCIPQTSTCYDDGYNFGYVQGITMEQSPTSSNFNNDFLVADDGIPGYDNVVDYNQITKFAMGANAVPTYLTLSSDRKELFIASRGTVYEYAYPSMKSITAYVEGGETFTGVATYPSGAYL